MEGPQRIFLVSCVGIPGVGKSTLLERLANASYLIKENVAIVYVQEPSALWRENGWLAKFYENPDMNAAGFQFLVFDSHVDAVTKAIADAKKQYVTASVIILLVERSMYCQRLFWELQVENKCSTANSLYNDAYLRLWSKWRKFLPEPNLILYFYTTDISETMRRVDKRDRREEKQSSGLTYAYQIKLAAKHDLWYSSPNAYPLGAPSEGIPCARINMDSAFNNDTADKIYARIFEELNAL